MSESVWYLKRCDLFERLTPEQIQRIESRCRIRKVSSKEPIYLPADYADGVILLASGRVKLCGYTLDGKQSILTFIEPGEIFGELAIVEAGDREEYAEAVLASTVLLIPAEEMQRAIEVHATVSLGVTKLIGLRRRRIERRLKYLLFHSNRERLIHLLLELLEQYGKPTAEGLELGIKLSHQDLANEKEPLVIAMTESTMKTSGWEVCEAGDLRRIVRGLRVRRRDRQVAKVIGIGGAATVLVLVGFIALTQFRGTSPYNHGNIACEDVRDNLPDYMAGRVDEQLAKKINAHLAACPECGPMYQKMTSAMSTAQNTRHNHHASCRCEFFCSSPAVAMLENDR